MKNIKVINIGSFLLGQKQKNVRFLCGFHSQLIWVYSQLIRANFFSFAINVSRR